MGLTNAGFGVIMKPDSAFSLLLERMSIMKPSLIRLQAVVLLGCVLLTGTGCGNKSAQQSDTSGVIAEISDEAVPKSAVPKVSYVKVPSNPGVTVYSNAKAAIDASNLTQGYVSVKYIGGSNVRIKCQITKTGGTTYTYDLNNKGNYEVFPLTEGDGNYSIKVFENTSGSKYAQALSQDVSVALENDFTPFLYPNQYVDFTATSKSTKKAMELASPSGDQLETVANVYNYVINNIVYDTKLAQTVQSGYLPNVDAVLDSGKGICFDYAALMTAMLRSQNIPTKLVIGYSGDLYHAWINTYIDEIGWVDSIIYFDGTDWKLMDPTFAASGKGNKAVEQYIGDGKNYKSKYTY